MTPETQTHSHRTCMDGLGSIPALLGQNLMTQHARILDRIDTMEDRLGDKLDRVTKKVEAISRKKHSHCLALVSGLFRDPKALAGWIVIALMLTGHIGLEEIKSLAGTR